MRIVDKSASHGRPSVATREIDYRSIVENLQEGIWIIDADSITTFANEPMARMLGYTAEEMVGKHLFEFMDEHGVEMSKHNLERRAQGLAEQHDFELLHRDGSRVYTAMETAPITDENGNFVGAVAGVLDISERRRAEDALRASESRFRAVFEDASVAIVLASPRGKILQVNPAMERMLGYTAEELVGKEAAFVTHPDDRPATSRVFQSVVAGVGVEQLEKRYIRKDGQLVHAVTSVSVLHDADGQSKTLMAMLQDVSELRRAQAELVRVQRLESLGVLAGGIAHDYNNILTAVLANIALAREDAAPGSEQQEILRTAEDATQQAIKLARQLLTFARGGAPLRASIDLARLLDETIRFSMTGSPVHCELHIAPDLWPVHADSGQIGQVISNLVTNAVQAQPEGGSIEVRARNVELGQADDPALRAGCYVEVAVTDLGQGIGVEAITKVFDPYYTTKPRGTGLGLAVTHRIIHNHDGAIQVRSTPGRGTTFTIRLPAAKARPAREVGESAMAPELAARVLVMDDEATIRCVVSKVLGRRGCRVTETADGAQTLAAYERARVEGDPFDVVILDLTVPGGMGGLETLAHLREMDSEVCAVVSSGYSSDAAMADHRELGFADVLPKPYRPSDVVSLVERVLEGRGGRAEGARNGAP